MTINATQPHGIRYPLSDEKPKDASTHFKNLAEDVEAALTAVNLPPIADTGWIPVTGVHSDYESVNAALRVKNGILYGRGSIQKKSGNIPSGSVRVCDVPSGIATIPATENFVPAWKQTSSVAGLGWISTNRSINFNSNGGAVSSFVMNSVSGTPMD